MKVPALILCMIAAVIALIFAVQLISLYMSPPDLSAPAGLDENAQIDWDTYIAVLTPATYLAFGIIALASVFAGMAGGMLQFAEKRPALACGLIIAAAGLSYFIALRSIAFLYLAAALATPRKPEKAAEGLVAKALAFIVVTYAFQWIAGLLLNETFLSYTHFAGAVLLVLDTPSWSIYILGALLGAVLSAAACIMLYRRRQIIPSAALAISAVGFILLFTPFSGAAVLVPYALFVLALAALVIKLRKKHKAEPKSI